MISATVLAAGSALIPLAPELPSLLVGQAISGLASGTFVPLTIGFVVQSLKQTSCPTANGFAIVSLVVVGMLIPTPCWQE